MNSKIEIKGFEKDKKTELVQEGVYTFDIIEIPEQILTNNQLSAQTKIIYGLLFTIFCTHKYNSTIVITPQQISKKLALSVMTVYRSIRDLTKFELIEYNRERKSSKATFELTNLIFV